MAGYNSIRGNGLLSIITIGLLNLSALSAFQVELHEVEPKEPRKYPWQLCRGTQGRGIGDQVFAIDREITTCEIEGGDGEWFDKPVAPEMNPTSFFAVTIGAPPPEEGASNDSPVLYTDYPPGEKITMETGAWENAPAQFHLQRNGKFVNEMHYTDLTVKPKDRLYFYWPPLSENLPHGGNPDFRMLLAYRKIGSNLRLGYTLTRTSSASITPQHPQVQLIASDGQVWDKLQPLPDEKRHEYIAAVLAGNQPPPRELTADELAAQNKPSRIKSIFGKIGKSIFRQKGNAPNGGQPALGGQGGRGQEESKEEEKVDPNNINQQNRGPQWYEERVEEEVLLDEADPDDPNYGVGDLSLEDIEQVRRNNVAGNSQPGNVYQPWYSSLGHRGQRPGLPNPHGRIGDLDDNDPQQN
ncbi:hypothetical protein TWF481_000544 [Arthrobotrys musiformis]|uniref:Uncharacterized protein n=1 Tax=Arthrobotrys musiformis TaxID=47236 RepID=A0AAV9WMV7_9PEZI